MDYTILNLRFEIGELRMTDDRLVAIAGVQSHSFFELVLESIPVGLVYGNPGFEI